MVDIGKLKIKKKSYQFQVRKKFQDVQHFKVKQKTPLDSIKDQISGLINQKKSSKPSYQQPSTLSTTRPAGSFDFLVLGGMVLIALIILGVAWLYFATQFTSVAGQFRPTPDKPYIQNTILSGDVLTAGSRGTTEKVGALLIDYQSSNIINYTLNLTTYADKIPQNVFVLSSEKFEANSYSDFIYNLRSELSNSKIVVNEISIKQLETLPEGAIVIVPSGVVPKELLGVDSTISLSNLADRGIVVIYIGQPFTRMLNGSLVVSTPQSTLNSLPISFDQSNPSPSENGFNLYQPLYRVNSRGIWENKNLYGSVSLIKRGSGAVLFLPQTLDGGWRGNVTNAVSDVERIIVEVPWSDANSEPKSYFFENSTNYSGTRYFFTNTFDSENATIQVDITAYSPSSINPLKQRLYYYVQKTQKGDLYIDNGYVVAPTNLTSERIRVNAQLRESNPSQPDMSLVLEDINSTAVQENPQGNVNVQAEKSFDLPIYADRGEYILTLVDDFGRTYAKSYLNVVSIDAVYKGFGNGVYYFDFTKDGQPVNLQQVSASIDGGKYGTYTFTGTSNVSIDVKKYTSGDPLPPGTHTFEFTSGSGLKTSVSVTHQRVRRIFDEPIFLVVLFLTGALVVIGIVFARQDNIYFALDIPDFPPVARTKVPLSADTIVSVFEKANEAYRWQSTPLTPNEVKAGFKQIYFKGNPIFITDYNVDFLLTDLERRGLVIESMGYYGLKVWEQKTTNVT
jgi:hypothetical protein